MDNCNVIISYVPKTGTFSQQRDLSLSDNLAYLQVEPALIELYSQRYQHPYLFSPIQAKNNERTARIIISKWGQQMSSLSQYQIESYCQDTWLLLILNAYVNMASVLPLLTLTQIYIENNEEPRFLPLSCCSQDEYVKQFKQIIATVFKHKKTISSKSQQVKNLDDIKAWLQELKPKQEGKSIQQLIELKAGQAKTKDSPKIRLSQEEKTWILSFTTWKPNNKLELVYDGVKSQFQPAPLIQAAQKHNLLFLIETTEGKRAAFWMAAKPEINPASVFGTYYADKTQKSVILGLEKQSVHPLWQEGASVGFGNEILLAIGRVDIVLSAFNCSNVSHFPCSYSVDEDKKVTKAEELLGKEFTLRQLQVYRVN